MKRVLATAVLAAAGIAILLIGITTAVQAAGTPAQAQAMVEKAIAYYKANGPEKAFAEIDNHKGQFVHEDLYVVVYDMNGKCLAHGANKGFIGVDLIDNRDSDGVPFVKERIALVKAKGKGWQNYKFTNPVSRKIEPKTMYVERVGDLIFGCGAYHK